MTCAALHQRRLNSLLVALVFLMGSALMGWRRLRRWGR
jgi:hypothetical protein